MSRESFPGLVSFRDGSLMAVSCLEKAQRCPHGDFWNRQPSDPCESASAECALLIGLRLLASGFLLLDSHLHRVFLCPSAFWTCPLSCLRELCLAPPPLPSPLLPVDLVHHSFLMLVLLLSETLLRPCPPGT